MDTKPDLPALIAAYYKAQDPTLTQREIGEKANLGTQAQVSRLLAEAREQGYLREVFAFPAGLSPDDRRMIEDSFFPRHSELESALAERARELRDARAEGGSPFKRLHIVAAPGLDDEHDDKAREKAFQVFGASAAEIVAGYIDEAYGCSVAWGRTIEATVRHVHPRSTAPEPKKTFMPIAGEPTNFEPNGVSPSDAARTLAAAWPGSEHLSLRGVQARIPKSVYDNDEKNIARELVGYSNNYQKIFGGPRGQFGDRPGQERPLIAQVPMILTGIGDVRTSERTSEDQADPWYLETASAEDRSVLELAVGNIGGVWISRDDISRDDKLEIEELNKRWLGAQHDHFKHCSLTADMDRHLPGVVVLAVEPEKYKIVLEALYLMNVLIVSNQLANVLAETLLGH